MNLHNTDLDRALRGLPDFQPPADGWQRLQAKLAASTPRRRSTTPAFMAMAASALLAVGLALWMPARERQQPETAADEVGQLILRSQQLERELSTMGPVTSRDPALAVRTQALQGGVQLVDLQLNYAGAAAQSPQARRLWENRVELMSALVRTHAQARDLVAPAPSSETLL